MRTSKQLARSVFASLFMGCLVASCFHNGVEARDECAIDADCGEGFSCTVWACEAQKCVMKNAPAGAIADSSFEPPPCFRFVCDGDGSEVKEVDVTNKPSLSAEECHRYDCDADGNTVDVIDTTNVTSEVPGDCHKAICDASGAVMTSVDVNDEPANESGDCMKRTCDPNGNEIEIPDNDPPTAICQTFTCENGQAVGMPANQGKSCSNYGVVCGASGYCDACAAPDAMCTDPGPAANSHTLGQAFNLGDIGWCDENGYPVCDTLKSGMTSFYHYVDDGSGSFCVYDPYVRVQASAPVKLCEYFNCPNLACPAGTSSATLDGKAGCCVTGASPSMAVAPECYDIDVLITVESSAPSCVGYLLDFHT